jgi:hypothetical protein
LDAVIADVPDLIAVCVELLWVGVIGAEVKAILNPIGVCIGRDDGLTSVTLAVTITVELVEVRGLGAVVAGVTDPVSLSVFLEDVRHVRAVVLDVTDLILVHVLLD